MNSRWLTEQENAEFNRLSQAIFKGASFIVIEGTDKSKEEARYDELLKKHWSGMKEEAKKIERAFEQAREDRRNRSMTTATEGGAR